MFVPAGRVTVMVLPDVPSRAPEDEVVKPIVQVERAPAADDDGAADNDATDWAVVIEIDTEAGVVSELVDTDTVPGPGVVGLVTPFRVTVSTSPAGTEYPL
jgi:hypothetical protein